MLSTEIYIRNVTISIHTQEKNIQLTIDIPSEHCALYSTTAPTVDSSAFFYVLYDDAKYTSSIVHFYFNRAVSVQCTLHIISLFLYKLH